MEQLNEAGCKNSCYNNTVPTNIEPVSNMESNLHAKDYKTKIVWQNVLFFLWLHVFSVYGIYLGISSAQWKTLMFVALSYLFCNIGITAGYHRLWCHKSYKAKWPLQIILCIFGTMSAQGPIFWWCRDHRVHHKFTETNADPYSIKRGFFFAHIGWLMCRKHPDAIEKSKLISCEDLWENPLVRFQKKFYYPLALLFCYYLPVMMPIWFWEETLHNSFFVSGVAKHCFALNMAFVINSVAHAYGTRPYDKKIEARENWFLSLFACGEGWHNFHHTFPWDYSTSELGYTLNITKLFIDFMKVLGLAYDMKTATAFAIENAKLKTGDRTRNFKDIQVTQFK